ncbi:MAG: hypothetical protein WBA16_06085 [Nonlabens sp.]
MKESVRYDFPEAKDFRANYGLYNLNGVKLGGGEVDRPAGTVGLHTALLPAGYYLVVMEDATGNRASTHMIKE